MSNKTIFKRIALVAVSALGAGLLSVAPASAAISTQDSTNDFAIANGFKACVVKQGTTVIASTSDVNSMDGASLASTTGVTATIPVGGTITLHGYSRYATVTAKSLTTVAAGTSGGSAETISLQPTTNLWLIDGAAAGDQSTRFTVTGAAAGSVTVRFYSGDPSSSSTTVTAQMSITVVTSCSSNAWSDLRSAVQVMADNTTASPAYGNDVLLFEAGSDAYVSITGKNSYNDVLPSGSWTASATNGALVAIDTTDAIEGVFAAGTASFASKTADGTNIYVRVTPAAPETASSTVVTVSYNGAAVVSRTLTFYGEATKIALVANLIGKSGGEGMFWYQLVDAAGNKVPGSISVVSTSLTSRVSAVTNSVSALLTAAAPSGTVNSVNFTTYLPTTTYGIAKFTCSEAAGSGTATVTVSHTSAINSTVLTLPVVLTCAAGLNTYTVSTDKASYNVGDIATITITGKDASGAAVNDFTTVGSNPTLTAGGGTVVKAPTSTDTFLAGVKTYQVQLTTAGSFNVVATLAGDTTKTASASYKVVNPAAGVSNEEVLAAIVKLIASINKQIRALQKSLKR